MSTPVHVHSTPLGKIDSNIINAHHPKAIQLEGIYNEEQFEKVHVPANKTWAHMQVGNKTFYALIKKGHHLAIVPDPIFGKFTKNGFVGVNKQDAAGYVLVGKRMLSPTTRLVSGRIPKKARHGKTPTKDNALSSGDSTSTAAATQGNSTKAVFSRSSKKEIRVEEGFAISDANEMTQTVQIEDLFNF